MVSNDSLRTFEDLGQRLASVLKDAGINQFVPRARNVEELLCQWIRRSEGSVNFAPPERTPAHVSLAEELYQTYVMADVPSGSNGKFSVVSLFAGAGGSSLGYRLGGGMARAAVEFGPAAAVAYRRNHPSAVVAECNVRDILGLTNGVEEFLRRAGLTVGELDILDASPPCTEFSLAGRGIGDQTVPKTHSGVKQTNVATLPFAYAEFVHRAMPRVSVMENVPGLVSVTPALFERIQNALRFDDRGERLYYVNWRILVASDFGVPQKRARVIVISVRTDVAERVGINSDLDVLNLFPEATSGRVTIRAALKDLVQTPDDVRPFDRAMRLSHDVLSLLPSLVGPPTNHRRLKNAETNFSLTRCAWDLPAPTMVIAAQKPDRRCGALHPDQDRKFTIPELKRLFALPDDFHLAGTIDQGVECICNMVPPFMTKAVGTSIYEKVLKPNGEGLENQ